MPVPARKTAKRSPNPARQENKREALQLRQAGYSFKAIAERFNVDERTASRWIREELDAIPTFEAGVLKHLQRERLLTMLAQVYPLAVGRHVARDRNGAVVTTADGRPLMVPPLPGAHLAYIRQAVDIIDRL